jgi:hypothetical protein
MNADTALSAPVARRASAADTALPIDGESATIADPAVGGSSATIPVSTTVAAADIQAATADIGGDNRLSDLDEQQLQDLLGEVQSLRAVPPTEPDPVGMRIGGMENVTIGGGA